MIYTIILCLIAVVLGILIIPPFIVLPVIARFKMRFPYDSELALISHEYLPKYISEVFSQTWHMIRPDGFEAVMDVLEPEQEPAMTTTYFRFFVNLKERDMAFAMISIGGSGEEKQVTGGFMEFWTDFASGNRITTNNNGTPPTFRDVPESPTFRYPGEMDMHILYTIHQKNLSIYGGEEKILPPEGEEFKYMRDLLMKDMEMQVSTGYLYLDKSLSMYRPTWKGAFLMTWKNVIGIIRMKYGTRRKP